MNKTLLAALMLAGLFTTTGAMAQEKLAVKEEKLQSKSQLPKIDTDGDGKISKEEAEKATRGTLKEDFATIDTNKDNFLDQDEMKVYKDAKRAKRQPKKQK